MAGHGPERLGARPPSILEGSNRREAQPSADASVPSEEIPVEIPAQAMAGVVSSPPDETLALSGINIVGARSPIAEGRASTFSAGLSFSGAGEGNDLHEINLKNIKEAIERATAYPAYARLRRLEGIVLAEFSVGPDGMPGEIKILKGSGHGILDREVIKSIRRAGPYPPFSGRVEVPITFRLIEGGQ